MKQPEGLVNELPDDMTGHIVYFEDPLIVEAENDKIAKCYFMRVEGGFGAHRECTGRMLIGDFFCTLEDVKKNNVFYGGNTKCYPSGYLPDLFIKI